MNTLLEIVDKSRRLLRLAEIRERDIKFSRANKYLFLVIGLAAAAVTSVPFLALVYPPAVISREMHLAVLGTGVGMGTGLIIAICAMELFVSRRWWCRTVCPGGALYSLLGRWRLLRVRRDVDRCIGCGDCVRVCQFDLRPMLVQITGMECTNCGSCIAHCDSHALGYRLVLPSPENGNGSCKSAVETIRTVDTIDNRLPVSERTPSAAAKASMLVALLAVSLGWANPAWAHHILGLPHYSYKENYPQAPTLEYPATTGPYDVLMTSYPGNPVPGEPATIVFYIKNRNDNRPYAQPVCLRVLKTSTFGGNTVVMPAETRQPFDNEHKFTVIFPDDGEYVAELTMDVEGKPEVIGFLMVAGNPTATKSVLMLLGAGLVVFFITVRAIKKKRDRRRAKHARDAAHRDELATPKTELMSQQSRREGVA